MKRLRHIGDQWAELRKRAAAALNLLPGTRSPESRPTSGENNGPVFTFSDPTKVLFPGGDDDGDTPGAVPLGMLLESSAHKIVQRADELKTRANHLVSRIDDRAQGEITLATQSVRFLIGGVWLLTAVWLYLTGVGAMAGPVGMSAEDAQILARTFFPIGAAGIGVAMAAAALVAATGNGANDKVRREANDLGLFIAETAQDFDHDLTRLREEMNRRSKPEDAVYDLSRAHLIALEATAYFRKISFITGTEGEEAKLRFRKFLSRPSPPVAAEAFVVGVLLGALVVAVLFVPKPEITVGAIPDIAKYPWASNLLLFGGILYAGAGVILSLMGGVISAGAKVRAQADALDSLRSAFTTREAPRPIDVIRRIEDAVDVFRARVGGRRKRSSDDQSRDASSNQRSANFADNTSELDTPSWRQRDTSAKFVDAGFQAAPQTWRADAYAKKIESEQSGKTGSKRGLFKLKNPPHD
jgi:hypothetical protein